MASNGNGTNGTIKVLGWIGVTVVTILTLVITIYNTFHVPLADAINCEKETRASEDVAIRKELVQNYAEASSARTEIILALRDIQNDLKYIRRTSTENPR